MYRTLVADDDFLVRSYLKTLDSWEKAGYEIVDDAEDGEEAYGFLQKEKIDVLVTDLTMPVMDGIELKTGISILSCSAVMMILNM